MPIARVEPRLAEEASLTNFLPLRPSSPHPAPLKPLGTRAMSISRLPDKAQPGGLGGGEQALEEAFSMCGLQPSIQGVFCRSWGQ